MMTTTLPPITKQSAQTAVRELVNKYRADRKRHTEQPTREYYILPLFRALGWNTENPAEFTAEEKISRGFVDFGFYLHGNPVMYIETKALSTAKLDTTANIEQAIRYSYMRGVTWAILTNFEQIIVYNAEWDTTTADQMRVFTLSVDQFAEEQFDFLWLLSKPAFATRQLDIHAETFHKKAKREPVTTRLFRELTLWRKQLFDEFRGLSQTPIQDAGRVDNAVQRLIDRLIFIRSMEDRGIESQRRLLALVRENSENRLSKRRSVNLLRAELMSLFKELDGVYNSNIFAHSDLDEIEFKTAVADIIEGLYGDRVAMVQYDFNAISADVLGAVYEQYLSFKAQDPTAKTAITAKTVKRKTQGIYYTPQFIVRYIIQNTVGRALEAGTDPLSIKILDPACGSGSFLIEAFDFLDRWLSRTHPHIRTPERRDHILRHNLFGVDLDEQAVEVTRLNLLLRAAYERRLLPPLTHIQHGDSLITPKFDYHTAFPAVFSAGGFDVVVGNPPYVRQETLGADFKAHVETAYAVYAGTADLYVYFIERGLSLLKNEGRLGYILPNKWMRANYGKRLRAFLDGVMIDRVVDFGDLPVFPDATTYPSLLFVNNAPKNEAFYATDAQHFDMTADLGDFVTANEYPVTRSNLRADGWSLAKTDAQSVLDKIRSAGTPLGDYVNGKIYRGVLTGYNEAFVIDDAKRRELIAQDPRSADLIKPFLGGRDIKRYMLPHAERYIIFLSRAWIRAQMEASSDLTPLPPLQHGEGEKSGASASLADEEKPNLPTSESPLSNMERGFRGEVNSAWTWVSSTYPAIIAHLSQYKDRLMPRPKGHTGDWGGRASGNYEWYELQTSSAYYQDFEKPKIVYAEIALNGQFIFDVNHHYSSDTTYIISGLDLEEYHYLLGIFNSSIFTKTFSYVGSQIRGGYLRWKAQYMEKMPIPTADPTDRARLIGLVQSQLAYHAELGNLEKTASDRRFELNEHIARVDDQINRLVADLYGVAWEDVTRLG